MPSLVTFDNELKACIKVADRNGPKFDALRERAHKEVRKLATDGDISHDEERALKLEISNSRHLYGSQAELNTQKKLIGRLEKPFETSGDSSAQT